MQSLRKLIEKQCHEWIQHGLPSRNQLLGAAAELDLWKKKTGISGIWSATPLMLTATLDDGIGQGIEIIETFSIAMGMQVKPLGLLQSPEKIVAACHQQLPQFLGLTVLQIDSEADLARIGSHLPQTTRLIAGGPAFRYDPEMASRCGVHYVAANVADYMRYILNLDISRNAG